ncbi:hypothetical protein QJQ45_001933 [Haematococcus lacustris]|nr:hypothetical protein QJQ45_001933 [Haematococcus lacustris]
MIKRRTGLDRSVQVAGRSQPASSASRSQAAWQVASAVLPSEPQAEGWAHILALKVTWDALWEEYLKPRWRRNRWLDRDTNGCFNFQRMGESMQRPLELCSYEGLEALPPVGKEYQQGYKRVDDRLPKGRQRLYRAAQYHL